MKCRYENKIAKENGDDERDGNEKRLRGMYVQAHTRLHVCVLYKGLFMPKEEKDERKRGRSKETAAVRVRGRSGMVGRGKRGVYGGWRWRRWYGREGMGGLAGWLTVSIEHRMQNAATLGIRRQPEIYIKEWAKIVLKS
jgi:hypothetical protein